MHWGKNSKKVNFSARRTKKLVKSIIVVLLVVVLIGSSLSSAIAQKRLSFSLFGIFIPEMNQLFEKQVNEWARKNGVKVDIEFVSIDDLIVKLTTAAETGVGPDILGGQPHTAPLYPQVLLNVDEVAEELGRKYGGWFPAAEKICKVKGHWKAIPWYMSNQAILLRKDLLLAAGESMPSSGWTWEDLLRIAKKIKAATGIGMGFALGHASGDANQFCYPLLWSYGGKEVQEDGRTIALESPETKQALRYLKRLYDEAMLPGVLGWDDGSNNRVFLAGAISMTNNSGSIYWASKKANPFIRNNMTHMVFPSGPAGKFQLAEVRQYVIFKYTKYPELAKDLVKYVMEKDQYLPYMALGEGNTSPPLIAYTKHPMWQDSALYPFIEANEVLQPIGYPGPVTREAAETHARFIVVDMFANVARGIPVEEAISKAVDEMIAIYRK